MEDEKMEKDLVVDSLYRNRPDLEFGLIGGNGLRDAGFGLGRRGNFPRGNACAW
jgi:hypothetical protein